MHTYPPCHHWRRLAIIEYVPLLAAQLGVDFFDQKLGALCMTWLGDSVFSIRDAASKNLAALTRIFGVKWCKENIIPKIASLFNHSNYLYRMTALFCVSVLSTAVDTQAMRENLLPLVLRVAGDPVPNIRFNVAKSLGELASRVDKEVLDKNIKPTLENMCRDEDDDVAYFAKEALSGLKA